MSSESSIVACFFSHVNKLWSAFEQNDDNLFELNGSISISSMGNWVELTYGELMLYIQYQTTGSLIPAPKDTYRYESLGKVSIKNLNIHIDQVMSNEITSENEAPTKTLQLIHALIKMNEEHPERFDLNYIDLIDVLKATIGQKELIVKKLWDPLLTPDFSTFEIKLDSPL